MKRALLILTLLTVLVPAAALAEEGNTQPQPLIGPAPQQSSSSLQPGSSQQLQVQGQTGQAAPVGESLQSAPANAAQIQELLRGETIGEPSGATDSGEGERTWIRDAMYAAAGLVLLAALLWLRRGFAR